MCICLPNGKFNFKKKGSKNKLNPTLIEESSEEDEVHHKPVISNGNGLKKIHGDYANHQGSKIHGEYANHQGHYRQLSRDRQLPPVPDSGEFPISQNNTLRKPSLKQKHKSNEPPTIVNPEQPRPHVEDYGSIAESETYGESKSNAQSPTSAQPPSFKTAIADEMRDVDPLYASVVPQTKRADVTIDNANNAANFNNDNFLLNHLNDHGYSIIVKKSPVNEFNSLRKPDRSKTVSKDHCHQSLQSLNNPAPGLPMRLYKQSELFHLTNGNRVTKESTDIKMRDSKPSFNGSDTFRRYSQPPSTSEQRSYSGYVDESSIHDQDVLKSLQSTYNTPPIMRASLTNICPINRLDSDNDLNGGRLAVTIRDENNRPANDNIPSSNRDSGDFYRRITVRESLASLRERNALPDETIVPTTAPVNLHHVYEGLYDTLYYSSADNGRHVVPVESVTRSRVPSHVPAAPNPLQYLNQDNYLSITENPLALGFSHNFHLPPRGNSLDRPSVNDRSSVVYAGAGSDVYAEISDIYQSKQYDELPENKLPSKCNGGQINNGFIGCSSPGSVRVLLEIQSFRHMDSDVDISSRCTTPLHPYGKSIAVGTKPITYKPPQPVAISHPWYLPQKSSLPAQCTLAGKPPITKPKTPQNNLAIMTPLMERSMEGSSMFLNEPRTGPMANIDSLYDLFKLDANSDSVSRSSGPIGAAVPDQFSEPVRLRHRRTPSPDNHKQSFSPDAPPKMMRIIYPPFSGFDGQ